MFPVSAGTGPLLALHFTHFRRIRNSNGRERCRVDINKIKSLAKNLDGEGFLCYNWMALEETAGPGKANNDWSSGGFRWGAGNAS